jgi:superfamily II DNA or RNA helicase
MSISERISNISNVNRGKINTELQIKLENSKYMGDAPPRYIFPYEIDSNDNICLPFAYASQTLKLKRPGRQMFPEMKVKFTGTLRPDQADVKKEALSTLSKKGSVIVSCHTGWGKCLGLDTPVLLHSGDIVPVQNIKVGDVLMGDDSLPRNVLSICRGQEQMYKIAPVIGESFTVNESHILSLYISHNKRVVKLTNNFTAIWFNHEHCKLSCKMFNTITEAQHFLDNTNSPNVIDIEVRKYLKLSPAIKHILKCYKVGVEFTEKQVYIDPYILGSWLGGAVLTEPVIQVLYGNDVFSTMLQKYDIRREHKHIPPEYLHNSRNIRLQVLAGLLDTEPSNTYEITQSNKTLADNILYLARSLGFAAYIKEIKNKCMHEGTTGTYHTVSIYGKNVADIPVRLGGKKYLQNQPTNNTLVNSFVIVPIDDKDYYGFTIDGNHRFLLGDFTVTHNTISTINLAATIGFKTLVIVNKIVLIKQWTESINTFCPDAKVCKLTAKSQPEDADFYIMNAQNIEKMGKDFFKYIGLVVVDEAHMIMAETLSKSLQFINPRYLIGLTATPYRPDGLNILLELYFGSHKIIRKLWRKHTAFKIETGFKPKVELTANGKLNWNSILESQANSIERNELIVKIIKHFPERTFLVLTKRVIQGNYLVKRLEDIGVHVTSLIGSNQEYDPDARVLVGTGQKVGVGFDHKKLDTLMLAADFEEYYIQYMGRVFRTEESTPIIFDLVDNNGILKKHFDTRRNVYQEHGGTVKNFNCSSL